MARDDFRVGGRGAHYLFHGGNDAFNTAATLEVDERKAVGNEVVAHVDDIGFGEVDDGVAIGMTGDEVNCPDVFAVEVDGRTIVERDNRKRLFGGRLHGAIGNTGAVLHAFADIFLGDDRGVGTELGVASGVIAVPVSVDDEANGLVTDALEGSFDLGRERRELIVDDDNAIFAHGDTNVSTCSLQHVYRSGDRHDLDLDLGETVILS